MEFTLANIISNLLVLHFKSLSMDAVNFISSVHLFLHNFPKFFSTKCGGMWRKMQISNSSDPPHEASCNKETSRGEKRIDIAEINMVMSGLGMVDYLLEDDNNWNNKSLGEEDLLALFDEEEPSLDEIKETFGVFDANKDGFIDACELQRVLSGLGLKEGCSLEGCQRMITAFDHDQDGLIGFRDFLKFMENCLC